MIDWYSGFSMEGNFSFIKSVINKKSHTEKVSFFPKQRERWLISVSDSHAICLALPGMRLLGLWKPQFDACHQFLPLSMQFFVWMKIPTLWTWVRTANYQSFWHDGQCIFCVATLRLSTYCEWAHGGQIRGATIEGAGTLRFVLRELLEKADLRVADKKEGLQRQKSGFQIEERQMKTLRNLNRNPHIFRPHRSLLQPWKQMPGEILSSLW
jgi:hypothetical protein